MKRLLIVLIGVGASFASVLIGYHMLRSPDHPELFKPNGEILLFTTWYGYKSDEYSKVRFAASSREAVQIESWIAAHGTGWSYCSSQFSADNTQFDSDAYVIEFSKGRLHLSFPEAKHTDPDAWTNIERHLSADEEGYWLSLVKDIKRANQSSQPPPGRG